MTNVSFLETENLIHSLADELLKLKSAVQQYEETRTNLGNIYESLQKISVANQSLAENTKAFMVKLEQINLEGRLQQLHEQNTVLKQEQSRQNEQLGLLDAKMCQQHVHQSKTMSLTRILVLALLLAQVATIALLFLK
jgi:uncharacterized protein (DUF3084 family)